MVSVKDEATLRREVGDLQFKSIEVLAGVGGGPHFHDDGGGPGSGDVADDVAGHQESDAGVDDSGGVGRDQQVTEGREVVNWRASIPGQGVLRDLVGALSVLEVYTQVV